MSEIIFSIIALIVGYFLGRELLSIQTRQLKDSVEGLTEQVAHLQNSRDACDKALNETTAALDKEKNIHQQVQKTVVC